MPKISAINPSPQWSIRRIPTQPTGPHIKAAPKVKTLDFTQSSIELSTQKHQSLSALQKKKGRVRALNSLENIKQKLSRIHLKESLPPSLNLKLVDSFDHPKDTVQSSLSQSNKPRLKALGQRVEQIFSQAIEAQHKGFSALLALELLTTPLSEPNPLTLARKDSRWQTNILARLKQRPISNFDFLQSRPNRNAGKHLHALSQGQKAFWKEPVSAEAIQLLQQWASLYSGELLSARELSAGDLLQFQWQYTPTISVITPALSPETIEAIRKADALAQAFVIPKAGAPKGFEEGILSLFKAFLNILRAFDADMQKLLEQELSRLIAARALSAEFLDKQLQDLQFHNHSLKDVDWQGAKENFHTLQKLWLKDIQSPG